MSVPTSSQTVGPFFSIGMAYRNEVRGDPSVTPPGSISITGTICDGEGLPVPDAQLELWAANPAGEYESNTGFTRIATDDAGSFALNMPKPGQVDGQAPHVVVTIFMRGLLRHLHTRIYFEDHPANVTDTVLACVPEEKRMTLLAKPIEGQPNCYRWDIHLQGDEETVFFAY